MHRPMKLIVAQQRQWQKRNFYSFSFFDYILQLNFPEHIFELKKLETFADFILGSLLHHRILRFLTVLYYS